MNCQICNGKTHHFLKKEFSIPFAFQAVYRKCGDCGFVFSQTHREMSEAERDRLNHAYHTHHSGENNPNDPNWLGRVQAQADTICCAARGNVVNLASDWLDYGSGSGKLSELIYGCCKTNTKKYDRYEQLFDVDYSAIADVPKKSFGLTINTAVFEHLNFRHDWDNIHETLAPEGVLALHTLVCEEIPQNADWFYYLPVHSAFFTNKSMSILHSQWGYTCSSYEVNSRLWFWFKKPAGEVERKIQKINRCEERERFLFKEGFLDYWK